MNKKLKSIIVILNVIILLVACYWLYKNREPEPVTVILVQLVSLIMLFCENSITKKFNAGDVFDSELNIENKDKVKMKDITKSKVTVK